MEEKKIRLIAWVKVNKKQLILAGISITVIIGVILGLKNKKSIMDLWAVLEKNITQAPDKRMEILSIAPATPPAHKDIILVRSYTAPQKAFDVKQHIRNLSGGRLHSPEKATEAATLGITLLPNQTLVDTYTKWAV